MSSPSINDAAVSAINDFINLSSGQGVDVPPEPTAAEPVVTPPTPPVAESVAAPPSPFPEGQVDPASLVQDALSAFNPQLAPPPDVEPPIEPPDPLTPEEIEAVEQENRHNPKAGPVFAKLRAQLKEATVRAEAAEKARLTFQEQQDALGEERTRFAKDLEEKERLVNDLQDRLGKVNLEASPQFQRKYDLPLHETQASLAASLTRFGAASEADAPRLAASLLRANPDQLDDALGGLKPAIAGIVMGAWQKAQNIVAERQMALKEWQKTSTAMKVEESRSVSQETIRQRNQMAEQAITEAAANGCFVYTDTGTPETQQVAKKFRDGFSGFVQTASQAELVRKAADGFAAPSLYQIIKLQADRIRDLEGQTASRNRVSQMPVAPLDMSSSPGSPLPLPTPQIKGASPLERAENAAATAVKQMASQNRGM